MIHKQIVLFSNKWENIIIGIGIIFIIIQYLGTYNLQYDSIISISIWIEYLFLGLMLLLVLGMFYTFTLHKYLSI